MGKAWELVCHIMKSKNVRDMIAVKSEKFSDKWL